MSRSESCSCRRPCTRWPFTNTRACSSPSWGSRSRLDPAEELCSEEASESLTPSQTSPESESSTSVFRRVCRRGAEVSNMSSVSLVFVIEHIKCRTFSPCKQTPRCRPLPMVVRFPFGMGKIKHPLREGSSLMFRSRGVSGLTCMALFANPICVSAFSRSVSRARAASRCCSREASHFSISFCRYSTSAWISSSSSPSWCVSSFSLSLWTSSMRDSTFSPTAS
mmetsp:Transcript_69821/g.160519  ORF Transcript_69821/g.160519 Transcript_69821/m.160519 type:complete len:223 (-) Transcript_69821:689-1357(-)